MCISIENRSTKFSAAIIKNEELRNYANLLVEDSMNIRANLLHMSAIMATIASKRDTGILEEFDDSIVKFAESRLGIKKSQTYSMVEVGATFLDSDGKVLLQTKGWNNTQLMALLPMAGTGKNKKSPSDTLAACKELVRAGLIKSTMTVAQIKDVVREQRPDAQRLKAQAEKREQKKQDRTKAEQKTQEETRTNDTIPGTLLATIKLYQLEDGTVRVAWNGECNLFGDNNIENLVAIMRGAANYRPTND